MKKQTVTIRDIAKKAEVSVATVSRYLNESGYVEDEKRKRIAAIIEELDYRPNRLAQGLKSKATKNIVLIVPDIQNPFYSTMAVTAQQQMMKKGYTVTLFNTSGDHKMEMESIRTVQNIGADGIIFAAVSMNPDIEEALKKTSLPVVAVNISEAGCFDTVYGDAGTSTYLTTKYMIEMGHKKIAFAGSVIGNANTRNRKNGYISAMKEPGLQIREEYIFEMGQILNSDAGIKSGYYFSALQDKPTAICCSNDLIALGVYRAFYQLGIAIPDQMSVTGVDDIMYADLCSPRLTTITNDSEAYARVAIEALLDRLQGNYQGEVREYEIDRKLVIRDSVRELRDA